MMNDGIYMRIMLVNLDSMNDINSSIFTLISIPEASLVKISSNKHVEKII